MINFVPIILPFALISLHLERQSVFPPQRLTCPQKCRFCCDYHLFHGRDYLWLSTRGHGRVITPRPRRCFWKINENSDNFYVWIMTYSFYRPSPYGLNIHYGLFSYLWECSTPTPYSAKACRLFGASMSRIISVWNKFAAHTDGTYFWRVFHVYGRRSGQLNNQSRSRVRMSVR